MKDATATALYGAFRGANGVILVTTTGKNGPAKIQLRVENSISMPTQTIELADPITYMKLENEVAVLTRNPLGLLYLIHKVKLIIIAGNNPILYPLTIGKSMLMKDFTMNQREFEVSGGGGVACYYAFVCSFFQ